VLLGAFLAEPTLLERYADDLDGFTLEGQVEAARREVLNCLAAMDRLDGASLDNHLCRYGFAGLVHEARQLVASLAGESEAVGSTLANELDAMLARRRKKRAEAIEREASARVTSEDGMDVLAWRRLNELLNGAADDDRDW
jgi:hypothetical protein